MIRRHLVTEADIEKAMIDSYVAMPIADKAAASELVNLVLDAMFGEIED